MSKDNKTWLEEFEEKFNAGDDRTLVSDDTQAREKIRSDADDKYRGDRSDPRERRINTGGSKNSGGSRGNLYGDPYNDEKPPVYDGYERSGAAYDRRLNGGDYGGSSYGNGSNPNDPYNDPYRNYDEERMQRARNLAREAQYKDVASQKEELRRLRQQADLDERHDRREAKRHKAAKRPKPPKKKGRFKKIRRLILILILLLGVFCAYFLYMTSYFDKVDTSNNDLGINPGVDDQLSGYRNIAVLGSDARSNEGLDGSRTDAIIILSIKRSNGDINMISIMRDSYLKLENAEHNLVLDKITHAHHWAGGPGTVAALNRSLDLNIKEFVIFNWKAVADTVDALGGITVDIKKNEIRDLNKWGPETGRNVGRKYTKITSTGEQEIDGVQATTYCRIRKTSGGDPGRGRRYKKVMAAVMKKGITHPWKLHTLANDVFPNIRTNMSSPGMLWAVLRAPGYDIKKSYGWPKKYYGGILSNGLWNAVPRTLEWNVKWLHRKAFEQSGYEPSDTCSEISNEIIYQTGVQ